MTEAARVLVVDDDAAIRELLRSVLGFAGFTVQTAEDIADAERKFAAERPDVVVLDVMLPGGDGFSFLRSLRAGDVHTPVLFLTARDAIEDRVQGLAAGGDDYVTKPFSMVEVEARLRALLRRSRLPTRAGEGETVPTVLQCADLEVNEDRHTVVRGGRAIELSPTEFRLLSYLLTNQDRVVSKAQILDRVWQYDFGGDARVVERFVSNVRHKLDEHGAPLIHTVRGFGYTIRAPRSADGE